MSVEVCADCGAELVIAVTFEKLDHSGLVTFCGACAAELMSAAEPTKRAAETPPKRGKGRSAG